MYVIDPQIKSLLPKEDFFNMDILINNILKEKKELVFSNTRK